jgi:hypothetical protein
MCSFESDDLRALENMVVSDLRQPFPAAYSAIRAETQTPIPTQDSTN